jgi:hypothetical protein
MVSLKLDNNLGSIGEIQSGILKEIPLDTFWYSRK